MYYKAMLARDHRFDGKFFIGVKTTGIYCRPICPAKPKKENVEFFADASLAQKAGYRPCLRCRPESAPQSGAWLGTSAVVQRALRLIASRQFIEMNEDRFAEQFGMSARHLRRLFEEEIGLTPKQIASNNRLGFARKLIVETKLSMTAIAGEAGFNSLRRFNDAFLKQFKRSPTQLRKEQASKDSSEGLELSLSFRPPYDWSSILGFYKSHAIPGIEVVKDNSYSRIFEIHGQVGWFEVTPSKNEAQLSLRVVMENPQHLFEVMTRVRKMFDLDSDPLLIEESFKQSKLLSRLYKKTPGLRLPRAWDAFETSICSILGQLVSVKQANRLSEQLVQAYGEEVVHPVSGEKVKLFPCAKVLASASLNEVKTTLIRKQTIREFCQKKINLSQAQDPESFRHQLLQVKGIGAWTAEYISLRALGDTDAFPKTDLILKRALQLHPRLDLELIKPWRSYAAMYLWKEYALKLSKAVS